MKTGTNAVDPDHNHIIKDTAAKVTITSTEAILLISTILTMSPHIEGHLYTGTHQLTHEITAGHALGQPTGQLRKLCIRIHHILEEPKVIHTLEEIQESQ